MIVKTNRLSVCLKSTQEGFRLLLDSSDSILCDENYGETMRHWTRRVTMQHTNVGQALDTTTSGISKDLLHAHIRGILPLETSGSTSSEFASVLATSGTTGAEGETTPSSLQTQ